MAMHPKSSRLISANFAFFKFFIVTMSKSTITIGVKMDDNRVPESIEWTASDTSSDNLQKAKAFMLSFWDGAEKTALRIDLWTKDMMVDEMGDFFYQTFKMMADTFDRATHQEELVGDIKQFAEMFRKKFQAIQLKDSKA